MSKNVLGTELITCSVDPMTGYFRDGCCNTDVSDQGTHTVCAKVNDAFLLYSKSVGNDLSTPRPEWQFPGLKDGDYWCLCALRWKEAYEAGVAPKLKLEACHERCLDFIPLDIMVSFSQ